MDDIKDTVRYKRAETWYRQAVRSHSNDKLLNLRLIWKNDNTAIGEHKIMIGCGSVLTSFGNC